METFTSCVTIIPCEALETRDLSKALARADVCIVRNDGPLWRTLTAKDFAPMRRKVVIDGRQIQARGGTSRP